jgi:hypothetical protein
MLPAAWHHQLEVFHQQMEMVRSAITCDAMFSMGISDGMAANV